MEEIRILIENDKFRKIIFDSMYENFNIEKELKIDGKYIVYKFKCPENKKRAVINSFLKSLFLSYNTLVVIHGKRHENNDNDSKEIS